MPELLGSSAVTPPSSTQQSSNPPLLIHTLVLPELVDLRASAAEVLAAPSFPAVPLLVLTHGLEVLPQALDTIWQDLQAAHARLSPLGALVMAEDSHHFIQVDQPELVIRSVINVVKQTNVPGNRGIGAPAA